MIVTLGKINLLSVTLAGGPQIGTWYVGLKGGGAVAAGDTLASHVGWAEVNPYAGNRVAFVPGTITTNSVDNSLSKAAFTITSPVTVYGAFLCSVASGTVGTLFSAGDFASPRAVVVGETLNITVTITI